MSITVSDCLKLPSLREGVVVAGENGLSSIVNNISVLEITEESQISAMKDDINNFELCLTSFAGIAGNVEAQCKIIQYLADVGDVGLVIYYVGTIMQEVNPQIIQTANSLDFPIIVMPLNRIDFRYAKQFAMCLIFFSKIVPRIYSSTRTLQCPYLSFLQAGGHYQTF